jgi:hypothetical protein
MLELPAGMPASDSDLEEAAAVVGAITAGEPSLVGEMVADLAAGIRSRPLLITAADELAEQAAGYWIQALRRVGIEAHRHASPGLQVDLARIHLHGSNIAAADYAGAVIDDAGGDLVGEMIAQGRSAAARYQTLAVSGDALAAELGSAQSE